MKTRIRLTAQADLIKVQIVQAAIELFAGIGSINAADPELNKYKAVK